MEKLKVALLAGGDSSEREVSLKSAAQVSEALDRNKYDVYLIDVRGGNWTYTDPSGFSHKVDLNDFSLTLSGRRILLSYALIMIHGSPGEDGKLQGYFEMLGIPFSSSGMVSTVITFDKQACKRAVAESGLRVAKGIQLSRGEDICADELVREFGLPMFVKPNASGSSCGVSRVNRTEDIPVACEKAFGESDSILIEEFLDGREIACGILVAGGKEYLFPVTEIIPENEFFDYEAKYTPGLSREITPANIEVGIYNKLHELTRKAYLACGCRGIARVDFMLLKDGTPVLIEINSIPGMSNGSIVPQQVASCGMTMGQLLDLIIEDTMFVRKC